jgi:hypothetical protein
MVIYAEDKLQHGDIYTGIRYYFVALTRSIEYRKHWNVAHPVIKIMTEYYDKGEFEKAYQACENATIIINGYDDEGMMAFECAKIADKLNGENAP